MYIYDRLHNIIHNADNIKAECNLSSHDKNNCVLVDNLENVNEQGLLSEHASIPTRCKYCMDEEE